MKIKIYFFIIAFFFVAELHAQLFISKAKIEYEVKSNIKKTMGNDMFDEMLKENLPTFKTASYTFSFADNKSIYKFDHWDEREKIPAFLKRSDDAWLYSIPRQKEGDEIPQCVEYDNGERAHLH